MHRIHDAGKLAVVHIDLVDGLSSREIAVDSLNALCHPCLLYTSDTLAMKSMREDLKAVERLRKTAEQLSRQERDKSHDRGPER